VIPNGILMNDSADIKVQGSMVFVHLVLHMSDCCLIIGKLVRPLSTISCVETV